VAAALLADGHTLCVANERSGTVSLVDLRSQQVLGEWPVARKPSGLAALPDGKGLLVTDEAAGELIAMAVEGGGVKVRTRLAVGPYPVSVALLPGGRQATVAALWSRRLDVVDLSPPDGPRLLHTVRLPFAPRLQQVLPGTCRVVVADSFGGRLAVVDAAAGRVVAQHEMDGHNVRGMAVTADGRGLLLAHQLLGQHVPVTQENVRVGRVMSNVLRRLPLDQLADPRPQVALTGTVLQLGAVGAGAGDPAGLAVLEDSGLAVALAGVHQVVLLDRDGDESATISVGRRPTAVVPVPGGQLVAVDTFGDSLTVIDARRGTVTATISLGPRPRPTPQQRGEELFFDAGLSRDAWMSCHSCHTDGHSNGLMADTLGDDTFGTPKRTLTLMGTALTDPWAWNGQVKYLHEQVDKSLRLTMYASALEPGQAGDLVSFLHTLLPPPPAEPVADDDADRASAARGRQLFGRFGCVRCHIPPLTYSSHDAHDVGFADERGLRQFNPPSLRGVGQGRRFLHDNRAVTLEEVFTRFRHRVPSSLPRHDLDDLLRFLRSL
jgi:DNA-binding beta-propeller fold protein YncE/mono/diheme cytochrome c family protein